jgi:NADH-quinone oxidoreductase subunit F
MAQITHRLAHGGGLPEDIELLGSVARQIQNKCLCALGEFSIMAVLSALQLFPEDFSGKVSPIVEQEVQS